MRRTLLMGTRDHGDEPEAEPVLVEVDGDQVTLVLDDGQSLVLDRHELADALSVAKLEAA